MDCLERRLLKFQIEETVINTPPTLPRSSLSIPFLQIKGSQWSLLARKSDQGELQDWGKSIIWSLTKFGLDGSPHRRSQTGSSLLPLCYSSHHS